MGMFDWYNPVPKLKCPICRVDLDDWQGKDANCALFIWQQGVASPISQDADECNIDEANRNKFRLPPKFRIYTFCEKHWIEAECLAENEIWTTSKIIIVKDIQR